MRTQSKTAFDLSSSQYPHASLIRFAITFRSGHGYVVDLASLRGHRVCVCACSTRIKPTQSLSARTAHTGVKRTHSNHAHTSRVRAYQNDIAGVGLLSANANFLPFITPGKRSLSDRCAIIYEYLLRHLDCQKQRIEWFERYRVNQYGCHEIGLHD